MEILQNFMLNYPTLSYVAVLLAALLGMTFAGMFTGVLLFGWNGPFDSVPKLIIMLIPTFAVPILIVSSYNTYETKLINENAEYTNAVIYEFRPKRGKSSDRIHYKYIVDGVEYKESSIWYPKIDNLHIGDTIVIIYAKTNHSNSRIKRDSISFSTFPSCQKFSSCK